MINVNIPQPLLINIIVFIVAFLLGILIKSEKGRKFIMGIVKKIIDKTIVKLLDILFSRNGKED